MAIGISDTQIMTKLTVCITTFNRWGSCLRALLSVCGQSEITGLEVILIDDCSTDPIPVDVKKIINDNQIIYVRHEKNRGLSIARNSAINRASGEYFAFCDDDDTWPDGIASRLLTSAREGVEMVIVLSGSLRAICEPLLHRNLKLTDVIRHGITPPVSSQLYLTSMLRGVGGYNEVVKSGVDHDLWFTLLAANPRVVVSWGEPAICSNDAHAIRMTTVEQRRKAKIADAMKIWKPKIIQSLGEDFYRHFQESYNQYLAYRFFVLSMQRGDYLTASIKVLNRRVLFRLIKTICKKIVGSPDCGNFAAFRPKRRII